MNRPAIFLILVLAAPAFAEDAASLTHHVVLGEPYYAVRRITTEVPDADGKLVHHVLIRWEARNAEGWEWTKAPVETKGLDLTEQQQIKGTGPMRYTIWDPVQHKKTEWCSCERTAFVTPFDATQFGVGSSDALTTSVAHLATKIQDAPEFTYSSLNSRVMLNLSAEGMRALRADEDAPEKTAAELSTGVEVWYAPSLHLELSTVVFDKIAGTTTNSVITLAHNPDPELFKLPALPTSSRTGKTAAFAAAPKASHRTAHAAVAATTTPRARYPTIQTKLDPAPEVATVDVPAQRISTAPASVAQPTTSSAAAPGAKAATPEVASLIARSKLQVPDAAKTEKTTKPRPVKVYKNAPAGWPIGLPPL